MVPNAFEGWIYTDLTSFPLHISLCIVSQNNVVVYLVDRLLQNLYWQSVRSGDFLFFRDLMRLWWTAFSRFFDAIANIDIVWWFSQIPWLGNWCYLCDFPNWGYCRCFGNVLRIIASPSMGRTFVSNPLFLV